MTQPAGQPRIPLSRLQLPHPMSLQVFEEYEQAQRAVDYLSDREFPVQNVMIVGTDLKQVERVTGRVTSSRVLASGAASGAWMGAFFGLLMWAFVQGGGAAQFLTAVIVGAIFGMIWALILYRFTGGARDFTSVMQVVATRYEVLVEATLVGQARALLEDLRRGVPSDAGREPQSRIGAPPTVPQMPTMPPGASGPGVGGPYGLGHAGTDASVSAGPPPGGSGATAHPPYAVGTPTQIIPPGQSPPAGQPGQTPAAAPKYRTYGEALDAERAARRQPGPSDAAGHGPVAAAGSPVAERPRASTADDSAAEDAHDAPGQQGDRGA